MNKTAAPDIASQPQGARVFAAVGLPGIKKLLGYADGRRTLYCPGLFDPFHPLALLLGHGPFLKLIALCGGETLACLGTLGPIDQGRRMRRIVDGLRSGSRDADIAQAAGVTPRRVGQVRVVKSPHRPKS